MGSFNVACSVSSISISSGEKVMFIPLLPKHYRHKAPHLVQKNTSLTYPNDYFDPFCLPIEGKYNDYGSVEDIVKNANTEAIEKFFDITIEDFFECVCNRRDFSDTYSGIFKHFCMHQEELSGYNIEVNEELLTTLGFHAIDSEHYQFQDHHITVSFKVVDDKNSVVLKQNGETLITGLGYYSRANDFLDSYYTVTKYRLGIPHEKQHLVQILSDLSGMFVLKEIYDALAEYNYDNHSNAVLDYVSVSFLEENGFNRVSNGEQPLIDPHHDELWRKPGFDWDVKWNALGCVLMPSSRKEYCVAQKKDVKLLHQWWRIFTKTNPDETFPMPKNLNDVTDLEFEVIKGAFLDHAGYAVGRTNDNSDRHNIFSVQRFMETWEELTGDSLSAGALSYLSKYQIDYNLFRDSLLAYYKEQKIHGDDPNWRFTDNPFSYFTNHKYSFLSSFKEWNYFEEMYKKPIVLGKLCPEFSTYRDFFSAMFACNRFFFPAMNGDQYGDDPASKALYEKSLDIVKRRMKEAEEY